MPVKTVPWERAKIYDISIDWNHIWENPMENIYIIYMGKSMGNLRKTIEIFPIEIDEVSRFPVQIVPDFVINDDLTGFSQNDIDFAMEIGVLADANFFVERY